MPPLPPPLTLVVDPPPPLPRVVRVSRTPESPRNERGKVSSLDLNDLPRQLPPPLQVISSTPDSVPLRPSSVAVICNKPGLEETPPL